MRWIAIICSFMFIFVCRAQANEQVGTDHESKLAASSFEECLALTMWTYSGKSINDMVEAAKASDQNDSTVKPQSKKLLVFGHGADTIKIPKGWSVVGTAVRNDGEPLLFICH